MPDVADAIPIIAAAVALMLAAIAARRDLGAPLHIGAPILLLVAALLSGALCVAGAHGPTLLVLPALLLTCALIAEIDRRIQLVPDPLVIGVVALALTQPFGDPFWLQAIGAALLGCLFLGVRRAFAAFKIEEALGLGDVKLAAAIGAFLGPELGLAAVAFAGAATIAVISVRTGSATGGAASLTSAGAPFGIGLAAALAVLALWRWWAPA